MKISYSAAPTPAQREAAADLIDAGGQLAEKLDRAKFARACVIVTALDAAGRVIGVGAVIPGSFRPRFSKVPAG